MQHTVLVCGIGSIGSRHIRNLSSLGCTIYSSHYKDYTADQLAFLESKNVIPIQQYTDLPSNLSAAIICTPTFTHTQVLRELQLYTKNFYIEKPLSHSDENLEFLFDNKDGIIEIGCHLRSHIILDRLKHCLSMESHISGYQFSMGYSLDMWRPNTDYRNGFSSSTSLGGGALFELVHMVDLSIWLFGPIVQVTSFLDRRGILDIDDEDFCSLIFRHHNGITGQVQLDMISPSYRSDVTVVTPQSLYKFDLTTNALNIQGIDNKHHTLSPPKGFERNTLFMSHIKYFLMRIEDNKLPPRCSLHDGYHALQVLLASRKSNSSQSVCSIA